MASSCRGEAEAMAALGAIGATVDVFDHAEVHNIDEWTPIAENFPASDVTLAKNMFLKGKKGELVLVFALADTKTDLKVVAKAVGAGSGSLRFAPADVLLATMGVVQGAVTPLALVNDVNKEVQVVLDTRVLACAGPIAVHPCRNDKSVLLLSKDLDVFFKHMGTKVTTVDFAAATDAAVPAAAKAAPAAAKEKPEKKVDVKGKTKLGLDVKKGDDFSAWYTQVVVKAEMIEYYDVSGCYVIRPWAFHIWETIRRFFADAIAEMGVEESSFPMFVTKNVLEKEKNHIEGFAPEVAWVTKAGTADLEDPIAIRPTSETVMYPYFAKWIRSHRDLPVRLNQWCNVVRWEFSHPTPFIRTREFLWQEGHCAWETEDECQKEVREVLSLYASVYEELLAVPVVQGEKTDKEKFAGGHITTTVETFVAAVGRGCQGGTSHNLGQKFGEIFGISFEDSMGGKSIPWQNSWGLTTRTIGVMTMVHSDDKGLVLPPRVAQVQVVIVPVGITAATTSEDKQKVFDNCSKLAASLKAAGVRVRTDLRDNYSPGWRLNFWELKGVPISISLGPTEITNKTLDLCMRHDGQKKSVKWDDDEKVVGSAVAAALVDAQAAMFAKALVQRTEKTKVITKWAEFVPSLNEKCLLLAPWCGSRTCEDNVNTFSAEESKALSADKAEDEKAPSMGAKSLCIPYDQPCKDTDITSYACISKGCTAPAKSWVLWGRSY